VDAATFSADDDQLENIGIGAANRFSVACEGGQCLSGFEVPHLHRHETAIFGPRGKWEHLVADVFRRFEAHAEKRLTGCLEMSNRNRCS
jgi:hypothetical protein